MKKDKVLVVIPAYNEAENIEKVINEIKKDINYADILVVNDCSKDDTSTILPCLIRCHKYMMIGLLIKSFFLE